MSGDAYSWKNYRDMISEQNRDLSTYMIRMGFDHPACSKNIPFPGNFSEYLDPLRLMRSKSLGTELRGEAKKRGFFEKNAKKSSFPLYMYIESEPNMGQEVTHYKVSSEVVKLDKIKRFVPTELRCHCEDTVVKIERDYRDYLCKHKERYIEFLNQKLNGGSFFNPGLEEMEKFCKIDSKLTWRPKVSATYTLLTNMRISEKYGIILLSEEHKAITGEIPLEMACF